VAKRISEKAGEALARTHQASSSIVNSTRRPPPYSTSTPAGNICLSLSFRRIDPADHQSAVRSRLLKDDEQIWLSWHFIIYSELAEMGRFFFLLLGIYRIEVVMRILFLLRACGLFSVLLVFGLGFLYLVCFIAFS